MKQHKVKVSFFSMILFFTPLVFSSCGTTQKSVYFTDIDSLQLKSIANAAFVEPLIQTDDILSISIQTIDPNSSAALNQAQATAGGTLGQGAINGFLVDKNGNVEIPMLGILKLSGLTTSGAKEVIRKRAAVFYTDATIQVRFANYKITVLGEVAKPSAYTVPNEKVTVLDAISLAGDLTIFGKRENVLLIRENGADRQIVRLDLTSSKLLSSPYFYLKQNDVLYVEPNKAKIATNNAPRTQLITIGLSVLTLLVTIVSRF